ncbi:MAG TPA: cytochrome c oxidase subunit 4 [bacterium]|nr:cytochrome c oxidase subunit 4 [bacterium]
MSTTGRVMLGAAAFALVVAAIYWFVSYEMAGTLMLLTMTAGLAIAAVYLAARRGSPAADRPEARPADAAGEPVGVFASHSPWPVVLALGCAVGLTGLIYGWWLAALGGLAVTAALVGLVRDDRAAETPHGSPVRPSGGGSETGPPARSR